MFRLRSCKNTVSVDTKEMKMSPGMLHFRQWWEGNKGEENEQPAGTEETAGQSDVLQAK